MFPFIVAAPGYFFGKLTLGDLTQTTGAFGRVQGAMSWFVTSYGDIASWRATVDRLTFFMAAIDKVRTAESGLRVVPATDGAMIAFCTRAELQRGQQTQPCAACWSKAALSRNQASNS